MFRTPPRSQGVNDSAEADNSRKPSQLETNSSNYQDNVDERKVAQPEENYTNSQNDSTAKRKSSNSRHLEEPSDEVGGGQVPPSFQVTKFTPPSGKLGAVTRKGNEIRALLEDGTLDYELLTTLYNEYKEKINALHDACYSQKLTDSDAISSRKHWWETHYSAIVNVEISLQKYTDDLLNTKANKSLSVKSKVSGVSSISSRTSTSSARVRLAEKKAQLEATRLFNERMANLEREEIEHKQKVRAAQFEKLAVEREILEKELDKLDDVKQDGRRENIPDLTEVTHTNEKRLPTDSRLIEVLQRQSDITFSIAKHQERAELPRRSIPVFDGSDITVYNRFIQDFQRTVEQKCNEPADCFYYLLQFTSGTAHKIVQSCNQRDSARGYKQALKTLQLEYGNEHHTALSYIEKLENWPAIKSEDGLALRDLAIFLQTCENNMLDMSILNQLNNPQQIMKVVMKLPLELRKAWRVKTLNLVENSFNVNFSDLVSFIQVQSKLVNMPVFGAIREYVTKPSPSGFLSRKSLAISEPSEEEPPTRFERTENKTPSGSCYFCKKLNHVLNQCHFFKELSYEDRLSFIRTNTLCFGCLREGHFSRGCTNRLNCDYCTKRHPTVLHAAPTRVRENSEVPSKTPPRARMTNLCSNNGLGPPKENSRQIMCALMPLRIKVAGTNNILSVYAALDTCSTACFIDEGILSQLGVCGEETSITVSTIEKCNSELTTKVVHNLELYDFDNRRRDVIPVVYSQRNWPFSSADVPRCTDLSDKFSNIHVPVIDGKISLIIGMNKPKLLKPLAVAESADSSLYLTQHLLGWAINGIVERESKSHTVNRLNVQDSSIENQLNDLFIKDYIDDYTSHSKFSLDDLKWKAVMLNSINKTADNHYEIDLPLKENITLPNNRSQVFHSFQSLVKKFKVNSILYKDYQDFMTMMLREGLRNGCPRLS